MFALARDLLSEQRLPVILDCPAASPARVEEAVALARSAGARLKVIHCLADRDTRDERMARPVPRPSRAWRHPARRRPSDVEGDGREQSRYLPPGTFLACTSRPQAELVVDVVAYLRDGGRNDDCRGWEAVEPSGTGEGALCCRAFTSCASTCNW